ncbi:hypothetical protein K458DRAFT_424119 [Lentithecium fluviatile CBS 122367]|uniref:SAP domain-containing protein n=1 Tax=Lentithecium fluviatile CBS 122367 TaxID=1168545 RepID=A0A6G1IG99_9PLEO|nr:hypothetical protein K458DRAFT_424119 [Lentithecium fluviatile CBS 122367]
MQASRASSRALKAIAAGSKQTRGLHMTGPATFSSLLTSERPALNLPRDLAGLRAECQKRKLPTSGSKDELTARLSAHELANSRSFSTAIQNSKRPIPNTAEAGAPVRHFNTSRSLKAVKDSSTIDFAYIPDFDPDARSAPVDIRVPILPQTTSPNVQAVEEIEEVMLPTIYTVAADGTHIHAPAAMAEVADSNTVDFQGLASTVASKLTKPVEESAGMARQIWSDMMDDILGPKGPARA